MAPVKTALAALLLGASSLSFAAAELTETNSNALRLSVSRTSANQRRSVLTPRDLCSGKGVTCESCFGEGYTECPDGFNCHNPAIPESKCPGDGGSSPEPTSSPGGGGGGTDYCENGSSCESCFGKGYELCPGSTTSCWNPDDPKSTCDPNGGGNGGGSGGGNGGGSGDPDKMCADQYGEGSKSCGDNNCYNPTKGESCCKGGGSCREGEVCAAKEGFCCKKGAPDCDAADEGGDTGSSGSPTSNPTGSTSSSSGSRPTSTDSDSDSGSGGSSEPPPQFDGGAGSLRSPSLAVAAPLLLGGAGLMAML